MHNDNDWLSDIPWDQILKAVGEVLLVALLVLVGFLLFLAWLSEPAKGDTLPDAPKPKVVVNETQRVHPNRVWFTETIVLGGLYATDFTLTAKGLGQPCPSWPGCRMTERDPLYGTHPTNARLALVGGAIFAAESLVLRQTERSKHRWVRYAGRAFFVSVVVDEARAIRSWK